MRAYYYLFVAIALVNLTSCAIYPKPHIIEQNYQDGSKVASVETGNDYGGLLDESLSDARARLLAAIHKECPNAEILAEGVGEKDRVASVEVLGTVSYTKPAPWIRYRCQ